MTAARNPFGMAAMILWLAAATLVPVRAFGAEGATSGWREDFSGSWGGPTDRRAGYTDNGIALELTMRPGTRAAYSRSGTWAPDNALVRLSTDRGNSEGNEYRVGEADFPASVTLVFGRDSLKLGVKQRVWLFFRQIWNGFRPSGIRLTYAWGNRLPAGSMYRLWEEETVFILAGPDEAGKSIAAVRRPAEDFRAAYGRPPKGPVTEVLVEARRPSREKTPAVTTITFRVPSD